MTAKFNTIPLQSAAFSRDGRSVITMLEGEIEGANVVHHKMLKGDVTKFVTSRNLLHVILLIQGDAQFHVDGKDYRFAERMVFVPGTEQHLSVTANSDIHLLEIQWELGEEDVQELASSTTSFPIIQLYSTAEKYTEDCKSEKTISRSLIKQHTLPRFSMGSVETYGFDRVEPHEHPMLDQFFFTFPENEMDVIVDGQRFSVAGNMLLHIPLGSNHGVEVKDGKTLHYIWIDFLLDKDCEDYLDEIHKPIVE